MTNDTNTMYQILTKCRHRDKNKTQLLKQGRRGQRAVRSQSITQCHCRLVSKHTQKCVCPRNISFTFPTNPSRLWKMGLLFPAGWLPFFFVKLMGSIAKLHLWPRDAGGDYVQLKTLTLWRKRADEPQLIRSGEAVRKNTTAYSVRAKQFTDLLESEEIPRAFSKEVLYFSIRREKSLYLLSTAVTHFFISAAWACPFSQKPSASCINSFTLSLVCCGKKQQKSIVRQMNSTARNPRHSGNLPTTLSSQQGKTAGQRNVPWSSKSANSGPWSRPSRFPTKSGMFTTSKTNTNWAFLSEASASADRRQGGPVEEMEGTCMLPRGPAMPPPLPTHPSPGPLGPPRAAAAWDLAFWKCPRQRIPPTEILEVTLRHAFIFQFSVETEENSLARELSLEKYIKCSSLFQNSLSKKLFHLYIYLEKTFQLR